jgi:hypothetical protein
VAWLAACVSSGFVLASPAMPNSMIIVGSAARDAVVPGEGRIGIWAVIAVVR